MATYHSKSKSTPEWTEVAEDVPAEDEVLFTVSVVQEIGVVTKGSGKTATEAAFELVAKHQVQADYPQHAEYIFAGKSDATTTVIVKNEE